MKKLVKNNGTYWDFIRDLRNHPEVKIGFTKQNHITKKEHYAFMERYGVD